MAGRDDPSAMADFVSRHGLEGMPHVVDIDGELWLRFGVTYQPWWVFVNDDGTVIHNQLGALSDSEFADLVERLRTT